MEEKEKLDEEIEEVEEERNYDIKDILSKIDSESKNDPARSLDKEQLKELKSMNKVPKKCKKTKKTGQVTLTDDEGE